MDRRERWNDPEEAIRAALEARQSGVQTAIPAIVVSFDPETVTLAAQPVVQGTVQAATGAYSTVNLPVLQDVPVAFPRGGGCTLTFPISAGDEVLLVFSSRCIDGWWQTGQVGPAMDARMHSLSDAIAIPGLFSQVTKINGISTNSAQLRSNDGLTFIELDPTTGKVKIVAPGGFDVQAPQSNFSGEVLVNGLLTYVAGLIGSGGAGSAAEITGIFNVVGQIIANGKRVDDTHRHSGVQPGASNSGEVV
ncbi:Gp138 family membrane-puncturing spike protein [Bordetella avium]|uniref:Gp138 family membrane-puncturing spike protein n=1 Tax=Bordetella avium TaxID=521 RepID=UPI000E0BBFBC|nr:Gp138 family membrane-puncturing spike protein [Bordetella avium]UOK17562.1 baseplate assembly protein [Bordetella phage vB_BaM-IFTN9]RIQ11486.1 hypothetical protein D0432_16665 [Bordetella avium]RIQ17445.1 hypothetical protein D0850_11315 [Bordetella avium]RIQ42356.1 hypothetical protein D0847_10610 [Bordetella avium]RIQ42806.1 hypothetical protein D0846_12110 [Bordetella avium]